MFVCGVHYSDQLEHEICIQDEFTIRITHFTLYYAKSVVA
jgi:hypothetical protein